MKATFKFSQRIVNVNGILVSCLLCLALSLVSGCGCGLSPAEQAEVDKYIKEYGRDALIHYLVELGQTPKKEKNDEERILNMLNILFPRGQMLTSAVGLPMAI